MVILNLGQNPELDWRCQLVRGDHRRLLCQPQWPHSHLELLKVLKDNPTVHPVPIDEMLNEGVRTGLIERYLMFDRLYPKVFQMVNLACLEPVVLSPACI